MICQSLQPGMKKEGSVLTSKFIKDSDMEIKRQGKRRRRKFSSVCLYALLSCFLSFPLLSQDRIENKPINSVIVLINGESRESGLEELIPIGQGDLFYLKIFMKIFIQ